MENHDMLLNVDMFVKQKTCGFTRKTPINI